MISCLHLHVWVLKVFSYFKWFAHSTLPKFDFPHYGIFTVWYVLWTVTILDTSFFISVPRGIQSYMDKRLLYLFCSNWPTASIGLYCGHVLIPYSVLWSMWLWYKRGSLAYFKIIIVRNRLLLLAHFGEVTHTRLSCFNPLMKQIIYVIISIRFESVFAKMPLKTAPTKDIHFVQVPALLTHRDRVICASKLRHHWFR